MASIEPNMQLVRWDADNDPYDNDELAGNFTKIGAHDHTTNKGVQIPTGGIANGAVTTAKIADGAVTSAKIPDGAITAAKLAAGAAPSTFVFYVGHTFTVPGEVLAPTGTPTENYITPFWVPKTSGQTVELFAGYYKTEQGGVNVTLKRKPWGASEGDLTGWTSIGVTSTDAELTPTAIALANRDRLRLQINSISSTPWNFSFTIVLKHTVASA